jgi:hypothetical protein
MSVLLSIWGDFLEAELSRLKPASSLKSRSAFKGKTTVSDRAKPIFQNSPKQRAEHINP